MSATSDISDIEREDGEDGLDPAPSHPTLEQELDEKYPERPHNHSKTPPFHILHLTFFNPLNDNKKKPTGPVTSRKKQGPHGPHSLSPHEIRRAIIERFISKWRKEVGDDIYPAFRLIVPDKDRDRPMYGLKEKAIGKLLVRVMKINKNSEDGFSLLNWKLPGRNVASRMAGDFAGRCFEVISKRPMRTTVGDLTIEEVNQALDRLAAAQKEEQQMPIFQMLYNRMNAEEMMWLIRIVLRQMKIGATERTLFDVWHPDAETLYSVSSSLRRVCWELHDPAVRLDGESRDITLMQCFQPQLAQFQMHSFQKMVDRMYPTAEDATFWIEEKLDGERMQLHMTEDDSMTGGKRFAFWSRKAKDYTYLYGNGFYDDNSALTRHLKDAFHQGVQNIILDGEMITWDPEQDAIVPFGTLKTAALAESRNPYSTGQRPLYRVFDILFLNGAAITNYTLRDRRRALEASVHSIPRRLEIHAYEEATTAADIEPQLRKVVAEASEGLVLKNPRSKYRVNERNDDWLKVKPEYMTEFGESLDCIVIGGYYGSGHRGGRLATFLCGLRVDESHVKRGANPMKCYSFCKVGGGFTAADYAAVRHQTEGKWHDWDAKRPPIEFIELARGSGSGDVQLERPDVWIKPDDSVVLEIKAASVTPSDSFRVGLTLRFPRFKRIRNDKDWTSALSIKEFLDLRSSVEKEAKKKEFQLDDGRRRKRVKTGGGGGSSSRKAEVTVAGQVDVATAYDGPALNIFETLNFYIMTDSSQPDKHSKAEIEQLVKANGGSIYQTHTAASDMICVAERRTVKVASLQKHGDRDIIHPSWIFDCVRQAEADVGRSRLLLPLEPKHFFFALPASRKQSVRQVDVYADSYARDVSVTDLRNVCKHMKPAPSQTFDRSSFLARLESRGLTLQGIRGFLFADVVIYVDDPRKEAGEGSNLTLDLVLCKVRYAGGRASDLGDEQVTHVVVDGDDKTRLRSIRDSISTRRVLPRIVTSEWVEQCWAESTLIDEERFAPA
ncbi:MAG: DNA ligase (ATP) [Sarcosagium campestre]|nr:MAG: DNA ligase (ATP) [Sarcosagium campestre]